MSDDEPVTFESIEDAIAAIRARLPIDCCVMLHAEDCAMDEVDGVECDCTPILIEHPTEQV